MQSTPSRIALTIVLPLLTLLLGWQMGLHAGQVQGNNQLNTEEAGSGAVTSDPEDSVNLSLFWDVWRVLQSHYIDPSAMKTDDMVFGAIHGLVAGIGDPYTVFMTPGENTDFRDALSGHLQGIGAELLERDGVIVVVSPLKGSPAERAGVLPEDIIAEVNGEDVGGQSLQEVVSKVRGEKGTNVTIGIIRKNADDLIRLTITRDNITVPSAEYEIKETTNGKVGYLAINQFGAETMPEVRTFLNTVNPKELKGLIIDLRFNGGGYLDGAIELTSMFLPSGKVVSVSGRTEHQDHVVTGKTILPQIPLVVLINQGSASASEITAGSLQDNKRATIIGMKSFGKGTVQEVIDLEGGSSLRVTIARWLTPNGRDLGKEGVTPDIIVDRTLEDIEQEQDPQLEAALEFLTVGSVKTVKTGTGLVRD